MRRTRFRFRFFGQKHRSIVHRLRTTGQAFVFRLGVDTLKKQLFVFVFGHALARQNPVRTTLRHT